MQRNPPLSYWKRNLFEIHYLCNSAIHNVMLPSPQKDYLIHRFYATKILVVFRKKNQKHSLAKGAFTVVVLFFVFSLFPPLVSQCLAP